MCCVTVWPLWCVQVVGRSLLFLALLVGLQPFRNCGVQRLSTLLAVLRSIILCLSVTFIPGASTHSASHVLRVGYAVAALHVVCCLGLGLLCVAKVWRTMQGWHASGASDSCDPSDSSVVKKVRVCVCPGSTRPFCPCCTLLLPLRECDQLSARPLNPCLMAVSGCGG